MLHVMLWMGPIYSHWPTMYISSVSWDAICGPWHHEVNYQTFPVNQLKWRTTETEQFEFGNKYHYTPNKFIHQFHSSCTFVFMFCCHFKWMWIQFRIGIQWPKLGTAPTTPVKANALLSSLNMYFWAYWYLLKCI